MDQQSIFQAVALNNRGVDLVEKECYDEAIIAFTHSIGILRPLLPYMTTMSQDVSMEMDSDHYPQQPCAPLSQQEAKAHNTMHHDVASTSPQGFTNNEAQTTHGDVPFVFRDPIEIPLISIAKCTLCPRLFSKLAIVVIYNLALSCQLNALATSSMDQLLKAKGLYEFAFQIHLQESCDVTLLYSLALMNNLGLIYQEVDDHDRAQQCFQNMLATMMFLLESNEAGNIKQWDGLLSNVMDVIFVQKDAVASAA